MLGTVVQPSICEGSDGSIALTGLNNNVSYGLTYKKDGSNVSTTIVSDGTGIITIGSLPSGSYADFKVELDGCESTTLNRSCGISRSSASEYYIKHEYKSDELWRK